MSYVPASTISVPATVLRLIPALRVGCLTLALAAVSCGGTAPAPQDADDTDAASDREAHAPMPQMHAEIGALHEEQTAAAFKHSLRGLERCVEEGMQRIEFLSGDIAFYIEVNSSAQIQHIHAEESSLGDRTTERCMFDVLKRAEWPTPMGGDVGIARSSFQFDMHDSRPATDWDSERVDSGLTGIGDALQSCKSGHPGAFAATMYVNTDGAAMGASVTPTEPAGEDAVDCLVDALLRGTYESPGSWPAKVRFQL